LTVTDSQYNKIMNYSTQCWQDMDAVWDGRSDGSRDEAGSSVWDRSSGRGSFRGESGVPDCNQWVVCYVAM